MLARYGEWEGDSMLLDSDMCILLRCRGNSVAEVGGVVARRSGLGAPG